MRIFVDLDTQLVVLGAGQAQEVTDLRFVRGPTVPVEVQFLRNGAVQELSADATGAIEFKTAGRFDEDPATTGSAAWIKSGVGQTTSYLFIVPLVNTAMDAAFNVDGSDTNDVEKLELMVGIQWNEGGVIAETFKVKAVIFNDVVRDGDTLPEMPPFAYAVFPEDVDSLADLRAIPTTTAVLGYIIQILIEVSGQWSWLTYRLIAGPTTDVEPGQVEPDDYDGVTNDKHWEGAVGPSGAAGRDAGILYKWNTNTANTDPTSGHVKVDNATLASLTKLYINETDDDSNALAALLLTWGLGTSAIKGRLMIADPTNAANYLILDVVSAVTDNGSWDTFNATHVAHGGTLTNNLPVRLTFISRGDKGDTGATGAGFLATSATSFTPGTGSKVFTTQAGLAYTVGARVRVSSAAGPTTTWMEGVVTAYATTTLTVLVDLFLGTGAHIDWRINAAGEPGEQGGPGGVGDDGADGASYLATSVTSFTPGTGSKAFTTQTGLAYVVGSRARAASAAGPTTTWMEGVVTAYSGTTLTILVDKFLGSGAHVDWNLSVAGQFGVDGTDGDDGGTTYDAPVAIPSGATPTVDLTTTSMSTLRTLGANTTVSFSNPVAGKPSILQFKQGASSYTIDFPDIDYWVGTGGLQPVMSPTVDVVDVYTVWYDGTYYYASWAPGE